MIYTTGKRHLSLRGSIVDLFRFQVQRSVSESRSSSNVDRTLSNASTSETQAFGLEEKSEVTSLSSETFHVGWPVICSLQSHVNSRPSVVHPSPDRCGSPSIRLQLILDQINFSSRPSLFSKSFLFFLHVQCLIEQSIISQRFNDSNQW